MSGYLLENKETELPPKNASVWQNIRSFYHRFWSDEIPKAETEEGQERPDDISTLPWLEKFL